MKRLLMILAFFLAVPTLAQADSVEIHRDKHSDHILIRGTDGSGDGQIRFKVPRKGYWLVKGSLAAGSIHNGCAHTEQKYDKLWLVVTKKKCKITLPLAAGETITLDNTPGFKSVTVADGEVAKVSFGAGCWEYAAHINAGSVSTPYDQLAPHVSLHGQDVFGQHIDGWCNTKRVVISWHGHGYYKPANSLYCDCVGLDKWVQIGKAGGSATIVIRKMFKYK